MRSEPSERRLAENEVNFRELNERTHKGVKLVNEYAREDSQYEFVISDDTMFHFFCECSDLQCTERIRISLGDYDRIHKDRWSFTIRKGHENTAIERIVMTTPEYIVVHKLIKP